jgi:hypothetical protein
MVIRNDSIANAQSASKKTTSKPKPKTVKEQKAEDVKKVTGGRGH